MKLAVAQMNSTRDVEDNIRRACRFIEEASAGGAKLLILPEFFNTIFFAQYRDIAHHALAESDSGPTMAAIRRQARTCEIDVVATIYEQAEPGLYFDTAMHVRADGEILFKYRKVHPAAVHSLEKLYFRYGTRFDTYRFEDWRIGIGICYDMAFPETARCLSVNGAELLLAPYATSRVGMFQEVLRTRAFENGCFLAAANKVGQEGDWQFGGGSVIIDPTGTVLAAADTKTEALLTAEIDRDRVVDARIRFPSRRDRRPDLYKPLTTEVDSNL
jgi:predicted amidohydrolase